MAGTAISQNGTEVKKSLSDWDLVDHIVSRVSWITASDFTKNIATHCVDGREQCAIVGAPGGEAGEFLLSLGAIEEITGKEIPSESVERIFNSFIEWSGHFYMHSDSHMLEKLLHELKEDARFKDYFAGMLEEHALAALESFIRMPPSSMQEELLERLVRIVNLGCGHIALMRQHVEEYGVRKELVNQFLVAFYHALWRGEHIEWVVLKGDHAERAVVNVYAAQAGDTPSELPLVCPNCHGEQVFVNHPQAEQLRIERMYEFVERHFGVFYPLERQVFIDTATKLLQRHTGATLAHLAKGLPVFDAHVSRDGKCTVTLRGNVS